MSRMLELPDPLYSALEKEAKAKGMTPVDWIAAQLPAEISETPTEITTPPRTLADLFAGRVGRISSNGSESFSENTGQKFGDYLEEKKREGTL